MTPPGPSFPTLSADDREHVIRDVVDRDSTIELWLREMIWKARDGEPLSILCKRPLKGTTRSSPIILVHGLRGTVINWNTSKRSFQNALVKAGYETVCPELRGSGASRDAGSPPPRSILELLELDLIPLILWTAKRAHHPVTLIGHSLGGILSCLAAAVQPEKVDAVVALASPLKIGVDQPLIRLGARIWVAFSEAEHFRAVAESRGMGKALISGRRLIDRLSLPPKVRSSYPGSMEPELQAEFDEINAKEPAFPGLLRDLSRLALGRSLEGLELLETLERVHAPVLCVAADRDELVPAASVRGLYDALTKADKELLEVEGLGHTDIILGQEAPKRVWEPVLSWLDR